MCMQSFVALRVQKEHSIISIMKSYSEYKQTTNKHTTYVVEILSVKLITSDVEK